MSSRPAQGDPDTRSILERALAIVTEVRPGEGITAILMTLNLFLLLTAYYVIKPVREALILAIESGAEYKSYMGAAIALALLFAVPAYSAFANRVARNRLVVTVTLFFVSHLVLFYLASRQPSLRGNLGLMFYGWVGIFNMMVVAQIWAFANDIYTEEQGKRLFPLVGLGASVGAAVGSLVADALVVPIGVYQMLLVSAAILSLTALITQVVHVRQTRDRRRGSVGAPEDEPVPSSDGTSDRGRPEEDGNAEIPKDRSGAFSLVFRHRYLTLLALFSLTFTLVNTNGEYMLSRLVARHAEERAAAEITTADVQRFMEERDAADDLVAEELASKPAVYPDPETPETRAAAARQVLLNEHKRRVIGSTFGNFYLYVNILGVLLQMLVVSRLVRYLGLSRAFFILPVIALLDAAAVAVAPIFLILRIGKTLENAFDYSLNNTLRNMLWLPTTREMKYKAKQAVDTFFIRMGDVTSAAVVFVLAGQLALGVRAFALTNVALTVVWILLAAAIVREHQRLHEERDA